VRRRKRTARIVASLVLVSVVGAGGWLLWQRFGPAPWAGTNEAVSPSGGVAEAASGVIAEAVFEPAPDNQRAEDEVLAPVGRAAAPDTQPIAAPSDAASGGVERGSEPEVSTTQPAAPVSAAGEQTARREAVAPQAAGAAEKLSANPRIDASLRRYQAGEVIAARNELNRMLEISRDAAEQAELRRHLERIADATIFTRQPRADDPLMATYTIQAGDVLLNVGREFKVPHEVIMMINGIENPARIRAGQKICVPRGPFHARIYKSRFRMDVYLQDLFVRSFPVGLGVDQGTPEGKWVVKERLLNPTYYPPASAALKRIIPPDDPTNPLGERWIGLRGIEGGAVGQEGYGIHGTIEPESIGKAVSLGCIRMHNEDVEFLYKLMLPEHSTVTTLP